MMLFGHDFNDRQGAKADGIWRDSMLAEIAWHLPRMLGAYTDRQDFWHWFCGEVESLLAHADSDESRLYFKDRLNAILEDAGVEERLELTPMSSDPCATPSSSASISS
jgi:hypothetical protein